MYIPFEYQDNVKSRSAFKYYKGLLIRAVRFVKFSFFRFIARSRGAQIGSNTVITFALARKANKNLVVGEDTIIATAKIDLRDKVVIGSHCIVNKNVEIIRVSHFIDNCTTFEAHYYGKLTIDDYVWIATGAVLTPSCRIIEKGCVIGAYSVMVKNGEEMGVYGGNPALLLRYHNALHTDRVIVSMQGGDLLYYIKSR